MACAKGSRDRQNNKGGSGHPCLVPRCKGNEGEIILPVMTDAAGEWYNVLIIETKCEDCFSLLCCCAVCDCSSAFLLNLYLTFTLLFKVIIYNLIPTIFLVLSIKLI